MEQLTIDAALGDDYERIGFYLTEAGLEDASGARRFYMDLLRNGEFDLVARDFKLEASMVHEEFGHLSNAASATQAD